MKYLQIEQLTTNLRLGRPVEQWLGKKEIDGTVDFEVIRWVYIYRLKDGKYGTIYFEAFDDGNENFFDVYEFESFHADEPHGKQDIFNTFQEALQFSGDKYLCRMDRFVNYGMILDEYQNYFRQKNAAGS